MDFILKTGPFLWPIVIASVIGLAIFLEHAPAARHPLSMILENAPERWKTDCIALCQNRGYKIAETTHMNVILVR